jgi:hypothetical protein
MKRFLVIALALFMVLGFVGMASAAYIWFDASSTKGAGNMVPDDKWNLKPCEVVWLEMYISEVPKGERAVPDDPFSIGLLSMGLIANYDPDQLAVTDGTEVYTPNWYMSPKTDTSVDGVVDMIGGRLYPGLYGDDIHLGTIELHCKAIGCSPVTQIRGK